MRPRFAISLARPARGDGAVGGARAPTGTLGGGINVPTSHGKAPCAPKARRSASQRSTNHRAVDRSGAPRSGQLSLYPIKGSLLESGPSSNRTGAIISPPWGAWIRNVKIFFASVYSIVGWAKAPLRRAHHNKAQSLRREVGGHAIGRAFARPMALPTLRSRRLTSPPRTRERSSYNFIGCARTTLRSAATRPDRPRR